MLNIGVMTSSSNEQATSYGLEPWDNTAEHQDLGVPAKFWNVSVKNYLSQFGIILVTCDIHFQLEDCIGRKPNACKGTYKFPSHRPQTLTFVLVRIWEYLLHLSSKKEIKREYAARKLQYPPVQNNNGEPQIPLEILEKLNRK